MIVGVLALQGDFREHRRMLSLLGVESREVRLPSDLDSLDGLIIPGGESTTMGKLAVEFGLLDPLREAVDAGLPAFGTCAGMILLSREATDGVPDQPLLGVFDVAVRRNGYGRQVHSFEANVDVDGLEDGPMHAVFIRAPVVEKVGDDVEVLASLDDHPVVLRAGRHLVTAFHPELTADTRLHALWLSGWDRVPAS